MGGERLAQWVGKGWHSGWEKVGTVGGERLAQWVGKGCKNCIEIFRKWRMKVKVKV